MREASSSSSEASLSESSFKNLFQSTGSDSFSDALPEWLSEPDMVEGRQGNGQWNEEVEESVDFD